MKDITASRLALLFHEAYERLAPDFGYETRAETRFFNVDSPNGKLMIAVSREVLLELRATPEDSLHDLQRGQTYSTVFSNPPPDEWGSFQFTTSADAKRAEELFNRLSSERDTAIAALKGALIWVEDNSAPDPNRLAELKRLVEALS